MTPASSAEPPRAPLPGPIAGALAILVGILALALYLATLAPTVTLVDSGELVVAAHGLGVAHPPGFPLWLLLAHLATLLPWGSVAERVNASSALFAALAAAVLVLAFREASRDGARANRVEAAPWRWTDLVPAALAGLLLATSRTFWSYATLAEVYTLNTLLAIGILALLLRWRRDPAHDAPLLLAAALFGLALGVHHVTIGLLLPALAFLVWRSAGRPFYRSRRLTRTAAVALAACAAIYLYLPWGAAHPTGLNWGDPSSPRRLLWHLTGRQYRSFFDASFESLRAETLDWLALLGRSFGPPWLPLALLLALAGFVTLRRSDRTLFATLAILVATNSAFALLYSIAEDKDAYYLPTIVALCLAAGAGARALLARLDGPRRAGAAVALLSLPLLAAGSAWRALDRSADRIAAELVADALDGVATNGVLFTGEWQLYSPLLYFREVEGLRRDVVAIDVQLLRRSWYFAFLDRLAPVLLEGARPAVDLYLADLRAWELEPERYAEDRALTARIEERFYAMIFALVDSAREGGPVYATPDLALPPLASDPGLPQRLARRYVYLPRGLVFELATDTAFVDSGSPDWSSRGVFASRRPLDPNGVEATKVRPAYLAMITSRGLYLAGHGREPGARAAFEEALALDPGYEPARQALASLTPEP